eukprot:3865367-Amphidinium_carterae.1
MRALSSIPSHVPSKDLRCRQAKSSLFSLSKATNPVSISLTRFAPKSGKGVASTTFPTASVLLKM